MYEKVNPAHPDKVADRIAGAIVDLAYSKNEKPRVAVEVLIGHGHCYIINETDTTIYREEIGKIVNRLAPSIKEEKISYVEVCQNENLNENSKYYNATGDNGFFKGCPFTQEELFLTTIAQKIYKTVSTDGKYLIAKDIDELKTNMITICQSNITYTDYVDPVNRPVKDRITSCYRVNSKDKIIDFTQFNIEANEVYDHYDFNVNPLGDWTGGINVDSGATNRKIGSDLGSATCGGGLHGKDLTKPDVSVPIYLHKLAEQDGKEHTGWTAIGSMGVVIDDDWVDYDEIIKVAKQYIDELGGFEKLAEWGLIR